MNLCRMVCACFLFLLLPLQASADPVAEAEQIYQSAQDSWSSGDSDGALESLDKAFHLNPDVRFMYLRILVLEGMGDLDLALQVLEEFRAQLIEHPEVIDVAVVEERLRSGRSTEDSTAGAEEGMSWGPLLLGAAGAGLLGAAAYGVFGESCSVTSTRNGCLVGNETDMLPVSVYGGAGVVALTTALIWALSGPDDVESESAVRVGVGRLGVSVVGHF